ncbi:MAG TPA: hypothetical protein VH207_07215 [Chthoniobacterales bacterium]|nr:hypothetical protein [Chthoniobacterales bacterium]
MSTPIRGSGIFVCLIRTIRSIPSHLRQAPSWAEFMDEIEHEWLHYMRHHDSPERRLREKNPERFRLD